MEEDAMVWEPEIEEPRAPSRLGRALGGEERVLQQHDAGKLTVRERIDLLADPGTFREFGVMAGTADYEGNELAAFRPQPFVIGLVEVDDARSSSVVATTRRAGAAGRTTAASARAPTRRRWRWTLSADRAA